MTQLGITQWMNILGLPYLRRQLWPLSFGLPWLMGILKENKRFLGRDKKNPYRHLKKASLFACAIPFAHRLT